MRRRPQVGFSRAIRRMRVAKLGVEPRAADRVRPGLPPPVELEASAVPGQNGGGLNDDEAGPPARPEAGQPDPEDPVPSREAWSAHGSLEDQELMAEREVLEGDAGRPGGEGAQEGPESGRKKHRHPRGTATWFAPRVYAFTEPRC